MSCGHIVGIVQDRCLDDPIWRPSFNGDDSVPCVRQDGVKSVVPADAMMSSKSMVRKTLGFDGRKGRSIRVCLEEKDVSRERR